MVPAPASGSLDPSWLDDIEILHITAYSFEGGSTAETVREAVRQARRRGAKVSMDVSSTGMIDHFGVPAFLDLMAEVAPDFISANKDESANLGLADGVTPGPNLNRFGDAILLARQGKDSTNIFQAGKLLATVPVTPVDDVRDLTGAGDAPARASSRPTSPTGRPSGQLPCCRLVGARSALPRYEPHSFNPLP